MNISTIGGCYPATGYGSTWTVATTISNATAKVSKLFLHFFSLGSNGFLVGFGLLELSDFVISQRKVKKAHEEMQGPSIRKIADRSFFHVKKVGNIFSEYSLVHGSLYLASGLFGGLASLHDLQWLSLGVALPFAQHLGSGLFLYLNLYSLEQNMKLFHHAQRLSESENIEMQSFVPRLKLSSVLGMINNIGYILAILTSFFPPTLTIALALGIFSVFVGSLKIIYDYFCVTPDFGELKKTFESVL